MLAVEESDVLRPVCNHVCTPLHNEVDIGACLALSDYVVTFFDELVLETLRDELVVVVSAVAILEQGHPIVGERLELFDHLRVTFALLRRQSENDEVQCHLTFQLFLRLPLLGRL